MSFSAVNSVFTTITGISRDEWQSQPGLFWRVIHEADVGDMEEKICRCQPGTEPLISDFRVRHAKTGRVTHVQEYRYRTCDANGTPRGFEGIWLDVTRQTLAERRLAAAAWKETLAVLTLGMSHDFANIMAGIHSLAESFLAKIEREHPFHEGLELIKKNSLEATRLVQRVVHLNRGQVGERGYHDLNVVVAEVSEMVRMVLPRPVEVVTELAPGALPGYVDPVELRQVVINLALNASDAMPKGGRLELRTSLENDLPELPHRKGALPRLPAVCLTVRDSGSGIKPRHVATLFDPFFTTKAIHKGSGLGLYNAGLFVEKHQGCISVDSKEGAGSTFRLWLPRTVRPDASQGTSSSSTPVQRRRTILLVGPDRSVMENTAELLRSHGFYVATARHAEGASDLLGSRDYQFDGIMLLLESNHLIFTDLLREVHRLYARRLKLIVKPVGFDSDTLPSSLIANCDLVLESPLTELAIIDELKHLWKDDLVA